CRRAVRPRRRRRRRTTLLAVGDPGTVGGDIGRDRAARRRRPPSRGQVGPALTNAQLVPLLLGAVGGAMGVPGTPQGPRRGRPSWPGRGIPGGGGAAGLSRVA